MVPLPSTHLTCLMRYLKLLSHIPISLKPRTSEILFIYEKTFFEHLDFQTFFCNAQKKKASKQGHFHFYPTKFCSPKRQKQSQNKVAPMPRRGAASFPPLWYKKKKTEEFTIAVTASSTSSHLANKGYERWLTQRLCGSAKGKCADCVT